MAKMLDIAKHDTFVHTTEGTILASAYSHDGYHGIKTEFIAKSDNGQHAGRMAVRLDLNEDNELRILIYDERSENPMGEIEFKDGRACIT